MGEVYGKTVQKFNSDGVYLSAFRMDPYINQSYITGLSIAPNGDVWLSASGSGSTIGRFSSGGVFISSISDPGSAPDSIFVDSSTYIYAVYTGDKIVKKFSTTGAVLMTIGSPGSGDGQFNSPYDVGVDTMGFIYVVEAGNSRVQKFNPDGTFAAKWGTNGSGDSQLAWPQGIAVSTDGYVYVTDGNKRVQKFTLDGSTVARWGSDGAGNGQFGVMEEIVVTNGFVYVADGSWGSGNARIQKFDENGNYLGKWGKYGVNNFYSSMLSVGVSTTALYVNDYAYAKIFKFDLNGNYIDQWVSGTQSGSVGPLGVAVSTDGYIYGSDTVNSRILKWDEFGLQVLQFGSYGSGNGQLNLPSRIAISTENLVYVADYANHRIEVFTSTGGYVFKWGSSGPGDGQFAYPMGIAISTDNFVYVADQSNNRIQKFTSAGVFVTQWGSSGSGNGQFTNPNDVAVDKNGFVYVGELYGQRVQKFSPNGTYLTSWTLPQGYATSLAIDSSTNVYAGGGGWVTKFSQAPEPSSLSAIAALSASPGTNVGSVNVSWTWPQDLAWAAVHIEYSTSSSHTFSYAGAQVYVESNTVVLSQQSGGTTGGLDPGTQYYFKAWVTDAYGNYSAISNLANAVPTSPASFTTGFTNYGSGVPGGGWLSTATLPGSEVHINAVAADGAGNTYAAGSYYYNNSQDIFAQKRSPAGAVLWTKYYNDPDNYEDKSNGIAVDASGGVYVTGHVTYPPAYGSQNIWTRKYDGDGNVLWTSTSSSTGSNADTGSGITTDSSGNVYVIGRQYPVGSIDDIWIRKYNTDGLIQWTTGYGAGGSAYDAGYGIAVDTDANVYVTGKLGVTSQYDDVWAAKYNSANPPLLLWTTTYNGIGNYYDEGRGVAVDSGGDVYVTGAEGINGSGTKGILIRKYDTAGLLQWTTTYSGTGTEDGGNAVALDASASVYVAGTLAPVSMSGWLGKFGSDGLAHWTTTYTELTYNYANGVALDSSGNIYAGGYTAYTTGKSWLRRYNSDAFSSLGSGPANFVGAAVSTYSIQWAWDITGGATYYQVFSSGGIFLQNLEGNGATTWLEAGLAADTQYGRYVIAGNETGMSWASAVSAKYALARPPASLAVVGYSSYSVTVGWDQNFNQAWTGYQVRSSTDSGFGVWADAASSTDSAKTITALQAGTTYYFRVKALNGDSISTELSNTATRQTLAPPPVAPSGFAGAAVSNGSIQWTWAITSGATYYQVFSTGSALLQNIEGNGAVTWLESGLSTNTWYGRYVTAGNETGISSVSSSGYKYTLAAVPASLAIYAVYGTSVTLNWSPNGNPAGTTYSLASALNSGFSAGVSTATGIALTTRTVEGLSDGTTYYFRVWAVNGDNAATAPAAYLSTTTLDITPPARATGVSAADVQRDAGGKIAVSWTYTEPADIAGYGVYYATAQFSDVSAASGSVTGLLPGVTYYEFAGLAADTTPYYFAVAPVDNKGNVYLTALVSTGPVYASNNTVGTAGDWVIEAGFDPNVRVVIDPGTNSGKTIDVIAPEAAKAAIISVADTAAKAQQGIVSGAVDALNNTATEFKLGVSQTLDTEVAIYLSYKDAVLSAVLENGLRVFELDETNNVWVLVPGDQAIDKTARTVRVKTPHFSVYRLFATVQSAAALDSLKVFPNPVNFKNSVRNTVKFSGLTGQATIRIYDLAGGRVISIPPGTNTGGTVNDGANGLAEWNGKNDKGSRVARGTYIYLVTDPAGGRKSGKIGVLK